MNLKARIGYFYKEHEVPRLRPKHKGLDNLHHSLSKVDGTQKPFRFVVSEREAGKSTHWLQFYDYNFMRNDTVLVLRRQIADATETYIQDVEKIINKFSYVPVKFIYKTSDLASGIVDVYVAEYKRDAETGEDIFFNKRLFFRLLGMSNPMSRIKSLMLPKIHYILDDEFICNVRLGEKYLKDEAFKFKEIYNTFQRECEYPQLITYFFGNPYSVYNPYWEWLGVDTRKVKAGAFINEKNYVIECYQLTDALRKKILERNPLYQFDDSYRKYAFEGMAINDSNIRIADKPNGSKLKFIFKVEGKYLGFYRVPPTLEENSILYYCEELEWKPEYRRIAYCFDFNNLGTNASLVQRYHKELFTLLKYSIANNSVGYANVGCEYLTEEIYLKL